MVNIKEVAKYAGVSASTVSRVLTGTTPVSASARQKVLDAVKELDYQPNILAQGLKVGRTKTIGLFIPNVRDLVFPAAIRGIEDTAKKHGYTVVLCNTDDDHDKECSYIRSLRSRLINGFIFSTAKQDSSHLYELHDAQFPMVCLIRHLSDSTMNAVVLDNFDGARQAVQFLLQSDHKKIALINGNMDILLYRQRLAGYLQAHQDFGVVPDERLIFENIGGWHEGSKTMQSLLESGLQPDAVFAASDPKAIGVIQAIKRAGLRVPDDISVIGFDDSDIAALLDPPLTTVAQPFYEMGAQACTDLINLIENETCPKVQTNVFPAKLIVRSSVRTRR